MHRHVRMLEQEGAHGLGLMRREIVRDDVIRSALRLTGDDLGEEIDWTCTLVSPTVIAFQRTVEWWRRRSWEDSTTTIGSYRPRGRPRKVFADDRLFVAGFKCASDSRRSSRATLCNGFQEG